MVNIHYSDRWIPTRRASNVESVFISWRDHTLICKIPKSIATDARQISIIVKKYLAMDVLRKQDVSTSLSLIFCRSSFVIIRS